MRSGPAKAIFFMLIILVVFLFFFHTSEGGFQSKHGPTTPVNNLRLVLTGLFLLLISGIVTPALFDLCQSVLRRCRPQMLEFSAVLTCGTSLRC